MELDGGRRGGRLDAVRSEAEWGGASLTSRRRHDGARCPICQSVVLTESGALAFGIAAFALGPSERVGREGGCKHAYHHHCLADSVVRSGGEVACVAQRWNKWKRAEGAGDGDSRGALQACGSRITGWTEQSSLPRPRQGSSLPGGSVALGRRAADIDVLPGAGAGVGALLPDVSTWLAQDDEARRASCVVSVVRSSAQGVTEAQSAVLSRASKVSERGGLALDAVSLSVREMVVEPEAQAVNTLTGVTVDGSLRSILKRARHPETETTTLRCDRL